MYIQCTPNIVAMFIVAIQIKWPLVLGQNTFILLYSSGIYWSIRYSAKKGGPKLATISEVHCIC